MRGVCDVPTSRVRASIAAQSLNESQRLRNTRTDNTNIGAANAQVTTPTARRSDHRPAATVVTVCEPGDTRESRKRLVVRRSVGERALQNQRPCRHLIQLRDGPLVALLRYVR